MLIPQAREKHLLFRTEKKQKAKSRSHASLGMTWSRGFQQPAN